MDVTLLTFHLLYEIGQWFQCFFYPEVDDESSTVIWQPIRLIKFNQYTIDGGQIFIALLQVLYISKKTPTGPIEGTPKKTWVSNSSIATYLVRGLLGFGPIQFLMGSIPSLWSLCFFCGKTPTWDAKSTNLGCQNTNLGLGCNISAFFLGIVPPIFGGSLVLMHL